MSSEKKSLFSKMFNVNSGCGCSKPKISEIFQPVPKNHRSLPNYSSNSLEKSCGHSIDDYEEDNTSTTFSINIDTSSSLCSDQENDPTASKMVSPCSKISGSVAVVKDSDDPYNDFQQSMLQMIVEREIYSKDELNELLNRFFQLNDPNQYDIIIHAFREICNGRGALGKTYDFRKIL